MQLTQQQFREGLSDPDFAVGFIINNNPEAVAERLRSMDFIVSDADGIVRALNELLANGDGARFIQALSVPVDTSTLSAEEQVILGQQSLAMANVAGAKSNNIKDDGGFNWGAVFGGLAQGTLFYLDQTGQATVDPQAGATNAAAPPAASSSNTMWWVLGGVLLVAVIIAVLIIAKQGGK